MVSGPAMDHSERDRLSDGKGFIRPPDCRQGGEGAKDRDSIYFRFTGSRLAAIGSSPRPEEDSHQRKGNKKK